MVTHYPVLLYVVGFDLVVGVLIWRYLGLLRRARVKQRIPLSWVVIISLVNLGGTFCGASVEEAIAGFGGLSMVVLIISAISSLAKTDPKA